VFTAVASYVTFLLAFPVHILSILGSNITKNKFQDFTALLIITFLLLSLNVGRAAAIVLRGNNVSRCQIAGCLIKSLLKTERKK
jgi:flagellar biosynthesis component FlhA